MSTPTQARPTEVRGPGKVRPFAVTVLAGVVAAGVGLFAASRTWLVEVIAQPDPLPATSLARTGGSLDALLPALALVALAGVGGLLATRGLARQLVAGLIALAGLGMAVSLIGTVGRSGVAIGWLVVSMLAGLAVAAVGVVALRHGRSWPSMGARYERPAPKATNDRDLWAALERGEDPTKE